MLPIFTIDRIRHSRGDGEFEGKSKFRTASLFGVTFLADIIMEGEVETESKSLGRPSSLLFNLTHIS